MREEVTLEFVGGPDDGAELQVAKGELAVGRYVRRKSATAPARFVYTSDVPFDGEARLLVLRVADRALC